MLGDGVLDAHGLARRRPLVAVAVLANRRRPNTLIDSGDDVHGRNLRVFRSSADREAQLLQSILAPALRSRNPERRNEAIEALENLASVTTHLKHLLLIRDLRKIAT